MPTSTPSLRSTEALLRDYLHAKDENRPLLMARAFASDVVINVVQRAPSIFFPPHAHGLAAFTDSAVRKFGQTYENIYTFYLARPEPNIMLSEYTCDWVMGMSEKSSGAVLIGCGRYDWEFHAMPHRVKRLTITIETMLSLPPSTASGIFGWLTAVPYPWADRKQMVALAPPIEALAPVMHHLQHPNNAHFLPGTPL